MKKIGLILLFLLSYFVGISQQKIIIRGAGAIDTTGRFVYDVFLSNDSLFYSKGGNNVYIGKLIAVTDDSLQTVMRRSSVLTENGNIVNNQIGNPYYNIIMDAPSGRKNAYYSLALNSGSDLYWYGNGDSTSLLQVGNGGFNAMVVKNSGNKAEFLMPLGSEDVGFRTTFNGLAQYNEATVPSGTSAAGAFHVKTETGAHYAFPRSKPTLNQILKVTDTTTYPDMQVLSWVDGIDSLKVDSVKVYSSACVDTFKYWVSGTATTIATVDKQNGLNSGGAVTPAATDTTFDVAAAVYKILCERYASAATLVTLNGNSDSSKGRIDVIGVNTSGVVFGLQGTNATNPIAPALSATQLGLATVTFPPLSDSGIVNIYNNYDFNGIDSSAYREVATTPDSLCFIFTSLLRSDTVCSTRSTTIDSLRRLGGSVNVEARKGGVWITQFTDSVGSGGGGSQNLDQVLTVGNNTDTTMNFIDSLSTGSGKTFLHLYPRGYGTTHGDGHRSALFSMNGYGYYPGVNGDGSANTVFLLAGYNGGFNSRTLANTASWGLRGETRYFLGGIPHSELHGFSPEFLPATGSTSRRLGTWYVNNFTGYSSFQSQGDNYSWYRGASDTVQFSSTMNAFNIGFKTAGNLTIGIGDSTANYFNINKGLNSTTFSINTPSAAAASVSYMAFSSPISVATSATYGTTNNAAITTSVTISGRAGIKNNYTLSTGDFYGETAVANTSGKTYTSWGQNSGSGGTWSELQAATNAIAGYSLYDISQGRQWDMYFKAGQSNRALKFRFNTTTLDSLFQIDGITGYAKFRYNVAIGSTEATARLLLPAGTATASTAPLKLTSGTNLTTAEDGAVEYNGTNLFFTPSSAARNNVLMTASVNSVSPTSPNRTITVVIDGTTYYIQAKTTND